MARTPKPWFNRERQGWFVTINGVRHNLGKKKKQATAEFHRLMRQPAEHQRVSPQSLAALTTPFLAGSKNIVRRIPTNGIATGWSDSWSVIRT